MKKKKLVYEKIRVTVNGYGIIGKRISNSTAFINKTNNSMEIIQGNIFKHLFK
jgi:glyceraldehyde-3-phosphate dehydrogenase/erythrose-4-phosphate dehydrogenase